MGTFDLLLLIAGGLLLVLDVFSEVVRRLWLSVPLLATVAGVLLGPEVLGVLVPEELGEGKTILEGLARVALALAVVDIALRFDTGTLKRVLRSGLQLLVGGMLGMWVLTGLGAWLLLDVPFWVGMLIGAILTPTDPVVAATLTSEAMARRNLPLRLRRVLQLESGANDGLAIVLFLLPVLILSKPSGEVAEWIATSAREVAIGVGGGILLGTIAAYATNFSIRHKDVQRPLLVGVTVGLALLTLGGSHLLEGSGIIAAFVGGLAFAGIVDDEPRERLEELHQTVANLLVPPVFAFFGALVPWGGWADLGWLGLAFAAWVLLLRRPPVVPLALLGTREPRRDRLFLAWFGPLGVAAMYYATLVHTYDVPQQDTIFAAATLGIAASVVAHAVSATPWVRLYADRSPTAPMRHPLTGEGDLDESERRREGGLL